MSGSVIRIIIMTASMVLLAFLLAFIVSATLAKNKIAADERLEELREKEGDAAEMGLVKSEKKTSRKRRESRRRSSFFEKLAEELFKELQSADIKMRPEEFMTIWILVAVLPSGIVTMLLSNATIALILFIVGLAAPMTFIQRKKKSRIKKFESQLSDALMMSCSCLKSGLSFTQSMETIAKDMDAPISTEFKTVIAEMGLGASMEDSLERLNVRMKSNYVSLMVSAVLVQRQTGGNLSQILDNIANSIKEREKLKKEYKSLIASGKMTGTIVGLMPVAILLMFSAVNWEFTQPLFTTNTGHIFLGAAAVLEGLCFVVVKKITAIKM